MLYSPPMPEPLISASAVEAAVRDCLYTQEEIETLPKDENGVPAGTVVVEGILGPMGFHPERLEAKREQVTEWLQGLPLAFRPATVVESNGATGGGGWSFLNACMARPYPVRYQIHTVNVNA